MFSSLGFTCTCGTIGMSTRLKKSAIVAVILLGMTVELKKGTKAKMVPTLIKIKNRERKSLHANFKSSFI
jgi:hypothetical protein